MTEEYRNELISRISKLNGTSRLYIKRFFITLALCLCAAFLGLLIYLLLPLDIEAEKNFFFSHFCSFFDGGSFFSAARDILSFSQTDFVFLLLIMLSGYTMVPTVVSRALVLWRSAEIGYITSAIYVFLISENSISFSKGAFALFVLCKVMILLLLIFAALESEDFSYRFSGIFGRTNRPYFSVSSASYLKKLLCVTGFSVIINTLYLIFQAIQNYSPL